MGEDSYKLFVKYMTEPVVVYTRSSDGYALDINLFGDCEQNVPLGIRTSQTGSISLQFEGIEDFLPEYEVFLIDAENGNMKINLKQMPEYSFEKTKADLFMDGRLYLSFNKVSNNDLFPTQGTISIFTAGNRLQVISNHLNINEVQVFDMQGRMMHKAANIGNPVYAYDLESNRMYVVRVSDGQKAVVKKIVTGN